MPRFRSKSLCLAVSALVIIVCSTVAVSDDAPNLANGKVTPRDLLRQLLDSVGDGPNSGALLSWIAIDSARCRDMETALRAVARSRQDDSRDSVMRRVAEAQAEHDVPGAIATASRMGRFKAYTIAIIAISP